MPAGGTCCWFSPEESGYKPWGIVVGCGPNTRCGSAKGERCICNGVVDRSTGECNCPPSKVCGNTCCLKNERCEFTPDSECVPCDDADRCGSDCCEQGTVCRDKSRSLCCVKTWKACQAGQAGVVKCCPPRDSCCFNCSKGLCCAKGLVNCDGKCCKPHLCVASSGKKVCCPLERIATPSHGPLCCPPGTVPSGGDACCAPGNPDCCDKGGVTQVCAKGRVCVDGHCR